MIRAIRAWIRHAHPAYGHLLPPAGEGMRLAALGISQSNSLPGFIRPSGSNAARTLRINAISAALRVLDR